MMSSREIQRHAKIEKRKVFPSGHFCLHFRVLNLVMPFSAMPEETFLLSRVMNNLSPEWKLRISPTAPIKAQSLLRLGFLLLWYNPLQMEITVRLIFSPSGNMSMRSWYKLFLWLLCFAEGKKNSISLSDPENFSSMLLCVCVCFSSVQSLSHVRFCDPTDCSTPGLPVHHQLPEFTQTHVH